MRVPDQIKKCVLFVGLPEIPDPEYRGTGFIVTVPGTEQNDFAFMVTARHVAEHLQGKDFYIRVNRKNGGAIALRGLADNPWWYHPTERKFVDAAITLFAPERLAELDVERIPIGMFADRAVIAQYNLGVGDEVFITGLFTKVTETANNIPIVRTGTVAMMPDERIPFGDDLIEAYLVEARSIGGLSGSPVFVRETVRIPVHGDSSGAHAGTIIMVNNKPLRPVTWHGEMHGVGRFYLFGSMIGHWEIPNGFTPSMSEAVNMGIAPIVPAHKIREIILQPEVVDLMDKVNKEMRSKNQKGAKLDFAPSKKETFTQDDFEAVLKKASRKIAPESK